MTGKAIAPITQQTTSELQHWLTRFVLGLRKNFLLRNSLYYICCSIMRHLQLSGKPSINYFTDTDFPHFKASFDSEMKWLQSKGAGSHKRQAEVLTEEEETLWTKGLLGDSSSQTLLDTMVFYSGLYFALRSGKEHCQLCSHPCQISIVEQPGH